MPDTATLTAGSILIERFRILDQIGGGAMAQVYRVEEIETGKHYALKVQSGTEEEAERQRTLMTSGHREVEMLSNLSHPTLPCFVDSWQEDACIYIVMEYVEGENLKQFIEKNEIGERHILTIVYWAIQVCDVLNYLHRQVPPIVFRDIKPSNLILRPDDTICLVDFGIARRFRKGAPLDTMVLGSPGYAPPEQYGQEQTGPRADIYSLGATMHHLLTGRDPSISPFQWTAVRKDNPLVPISLEKLIMKCLELDPERRPESAEAVMKSLVIIRDNIEEAQRTAARSQATMRGGIPTVLEGQGTPTIQLKEGEEEAAVAVSNTRPRFVPAMPTPPPDDFVGTTANSAPILMTSLRTPRSALPKNMYRLVLVFSALCLLGGVTFPFWDSIAEPSMNVQVPDRPSAGASGQVLQDYERSKNQYNLELVAAEQRVSAYRKLTYFRYMILLVACFALFWGAIRPFRPTHMGMILAAVGTLGVVWLLAALLLPGREAIFAVLAVPVILMFIPIIYLLLWGSSDAYWNKRSTGD